jgi:hypothetical protein
MPLIDWRYLWTPFTCMGYGHVDSGMSMNKETGRICKEAFATLSSVGLSDTTLFFHIDEWHDFWGKRLLNLKCVF